jgi:hypothetical protein
MYTGIFNLFLGLLFQFNIVLRGIDILPDVVGYYFILKGLKILVDENRYFQLSNKLVLPLLVLSLVNLYNFQYHQEFLLSMSFAIDTVKIIVFALNLYLVYNLMMGMIVVIGNNNDYYLERNLRQRLYFYLGVAGIFLVISIMSLIPSASLASTIQYIFLIAYFTYLFALLIIVAGVHKVYRELAPVKAKPIRAKAGGGKAIKSGKSAKLGKSGQSKRKR